MAGADHVDDGASDRARYPACELDCLQGVLAPSLLKAAETRSGQLGLGADQVLIQWGVIDEQSYLWHLAAHLGIAIETFAKYGRDDCELPDRKLPDAAYHGMVPLRLDGGLIYVVAPRTLTARVLCQSAALSPSLTRTVRLATTKNLNQFLTQQARAELARFAAYGLRETCPDMSAAALPRREPHLLRRRLRIACLAILIALSPAGMLELASNGAALWFLTLIGLRLLGCLRPAQRVAATPRLPDHQLPIYTVMVALYREAASVAALVRALEAFDYPREKLDIILAVEPDDLQTRAAIARLGSKPNLQVLIAPVDGPKTKPKALNWALPFARGSFITVYDAEDRPHPGQLRAALDAFEAHGPEVACAQASLCIENVSDSWITRTFAKEYAGQFDVVLPGFAAMRLPLPLGGTSNHFRTHTLRDIGGWDAFNVTEDADLGFRLARLGYRSITFASTTMEEAPIGFRAWLRQRSRWMKGYMQTWEVHMREPRRLWREAGPRGFLALNVVIGGSVLTALSYPLLPLEITAYLATQHAEGGPMFAGLWLPLHLTTIVAGFLSTAAIGLLGLARRRQLRSAWVLLLTPVYWGCLSIAAWRALIQLQRNPYHWEKTEHGLAKRAPTPQPAHPSTASRLSKRRARQR